MIFDQKIKNIHIALICICMDYDFFPSGFCSSLLSHLCPRQTPFRINLITLWIIYCLLSILVYQFSSVQSLSRVWLFATPWIAARQASLSITNSWSLLKLMPIESVMPSSHLILCRPLLLPPPIPPSIRVFSSESTLRISGTPRADLLQDGLVGSPCSPRDSQESSPTPQFKTINSLALSFLHHPTLTSIHDHWKNHSLD